jgi:hypothetical protein
VNDAGRRQNQVLHVSSDPMFIRAQTPITMFALF